MAVLETDCARRFGRMCLDGWEQGWNEANGGNLSYLMTPEEVSACEPDFSFERPWTELGVEAPGLAGAHLMVTGSGKFMRNVALDPRGCTGILEVDGTGSAYRVVWGLEGGGRPTSELPTHIMNHEVRMRVTDGAARVIYHCHCPNVITLSTLLAPDARVWTRVLWKSMTECIMLFPQGVGVLPWMLPGSMDIARATAGLMERQAAVVWTQHGMFVSGADFDAAFGLMHAIEKAAGIYLAARAANGGAEPAYQVSDAQLVQVCESLGVEPNWDFLEDDSLI